MRYYFYTPLLEGSRDNMLEPYVDFFNNKRGTDISVSQFKQIMQRKLMNDASMDSLSLPSNFYLAGAIRYYFNGDLTDNKRLNVIYPQYKDRFKPEVCDKLNKIIVILRNAYIDSVGTKWAQPEDFGKLTIDKLFKKYDRVLDKMQAEKDKFNVTPTEGVSPLEYKDAKGTGGYSMEVVVTHTQCCKYRALTAPGSWCITYNDPGNYNGYTKRNNTHFIIFKKRGCEDIPYRPGMGFPKDKYGLSMLAVQQSNIDGHFVCCTTRWNHGGYNGVRSIPNADFVYRDEDTFCNETGITHEMLAKAFEAYRENKGNNISDLEKAKARADRAAERKDLIRKFKYAQMLINGGRTLDEIFNYPQLLQGNGKVSKSIYLVEFDGADDGFAATLCVRGKLLYDQIIFRDHILYCGKLKKDGWRHDDDENPNIIQIDMGYGGGEALFDIRGNKFIKVGEYKKFRECEAVKYDGDYSRFVLIHINGKKKALYDGKIGEVVNINGHEVFYTIKQSSKNIVGYTELPKGAIISFRVDEYGGYGSVRSGLFFYDTETCSAIPPPEDERVNKIVREEGIDYEFRIEYGEPRIVNGKSYIDYYITSYYLNLNVLYDPSRDDFFEIDGHKCFAGIESFGSVVIYRTCKSELKVVDLNRGNIEGPLVRLAKTNLFHIHFEESDCKDSCVVFWMYGGSFRYNTFAIYNVKLGRFISLGGNIGFYRVSSADNGNVYRIYPTKHEGKSDMTVFDYYPQTGELKRKIISSHWL